IEGVLNIVLSQTGITDKAVEFNGDNVSGKINIENASTGTLTTGYNLNASKTGNKIDGFAQNTGGGTLTNVLADNSTEDSNNIIIVDEPNNKLTRSRGGYKFRDGFEFDLGSDANGDIYYRDAGILKRLAKATNADRLILSAGLPAWFRALATPAEVKTGTDADRSPTVAGMNSHEGVAKAWINFDGTGTISIRDSYNVSSIVDNGVGNYIINWDTDFADTNYCAVNTGGRGTEQPVISTIDSLAVGSAQAIFDDSGGGNIDPLLCCIMAIGDQ
ncbi:hypothetical protein KAR91_14090, partial [Candidatus Pacearchaeota archaeon]|nr:hypothetical protein [Candidatus Pacearchaeota archaeon]